ncbi:ABC transporter ATP-binding protein [Geomicrobium sediminis]|uniref:ABC-2 type transport system ATP-binding protein n=1 Tax=Geomicrobium sediminis TaxID=1347788 RepID=A0ABS2PFZ8_9BACL|nr:ABC transporter ATP-binding protein [Geomicrobium sediminis]MBM7634353.1 ABC-2 type transport system ATP-binding protein [Geomicrobium sediminis]
MKPLVVKQLSRTFKGHKVINDLSFSLDRGLIYGFLGPNGSGKTMTIRLIVSLIKMDRGEVFIEGKDLNKNREEALQHIGAIVEDPDLYTYLSGRQNLEHFARMSQKPISEERIEQVIELVELTNRIDDKVKTYSLGMKQRLGIAVSILHQPSVLILDEPTNGLDPNGIKELRYYLRRLAKQDGVTLLVSSHQLREVEVLCDRAIVIKDGQAVDEFDLRSSATESTYTIHVTARPEADAHTQLAQFGNVEKNENQFVIYDQPYEQIPAIVEALVQQNVNVYEIRYEQGLEERYFSLLESERDER